MNERLTYIHLSVDSTADGWRVFRWIWDSLFLNRRLIVRLF